MPAIKVSSTQLILQTFALIAAGMVIGWPIGHLVEMGIPPQPQSLPAAARIFSWEMWGLLMGGCVGIVASAGLAYWQWRRLHPQCAPQD